MEAQGIVRTVSGHVFKAAPGISVADLGDRLGISMGRTWQIINISSTAESASPATSPPSAPDAPLAGNDLMHALVGHPRQPRDLTHSQPPHTQRGSHRRARAQPTTPDPSSPADRLPPSWRVIAIKQARHA